MPTLDDDPQVPVSGSNDVRVRILGATAPNGERRPQWALAVLRMTSALRFCFAAGAKTVVEMTGFLGS
ncbi:hypothetical protein VFPPC_15731 [Pochonia chlamydosporia 170]|uniref:Uncharacterized protein n=1 Tax=Pochonia chlamydosporia 170 TaxID=1380566 RepID=A0A179FRS8_METCM|nr:hypothetical protein VFPPC_15731 [Pochonia chlamydosporia 170]OAQ67793.1 hypothetical protein VFPPC_15731 [Pochonia chlamydosporia 170]